MSILVWFRDKLFGKDYAKPKEQVEPQITDAVTVTEPVEPMVQIPPRRRPVKKATSPRKRK